MPEEISGSDPSGDSERKPEAETPIQPTIEQRIVALEAENNARKDTSISKDLAKEVKRGEWWLITINGLALLASIGIGIIYIYQLSEMRKATTATAQAAYAACVSTQISQRTLIEAQIAEDDTHEAARAAIAQASVAIQTSIPVINPEIGVVALGTGIEIRHDISFKNTGNTPALKVLSGVRTIFVSNNENPPFTYPEKMTATMRSGQVPANTAFPLNKVRNVVKNPDGSIYIPTQRDHDEFIAGRKDVLVFGYVTYWDVYGDFHSMSFCQSARHVEEGEKLRYGHSECFRYNKINTEKPDTPEPIIPKKINNGPLIDCKKPQD